MFILGRYNGSTVSLLIDYLLLVILTELEIESFE
jgi:hypothetical protein